MSDNDTVVFGGEAFEWRVFKQRINSWSFSNESSLLNHATSLQTTILPQLWAKVAHIYCERYKLLFTKNVALDVPAHYILILDSSGSMVGGGWDALCNAVQQFFTIKSMSSVEHYYSVIKFDATAETVFAYTSSKLPVQEEVRKLRNSTFGLGTMYGAALNKVVEVLDRQPQTTAKLPVVIIFMSDGIPTDQSIPQFFALKGKYESQIQKFFAVGLQVLGQHCDFGVLKYMVMEMGREKGTFLLSTNINKLASTYKEIANSNIEVPSATGRRTLSSQSPRTTSSSFQNQ